MLKKVVCLLFLAVFSCSSIWAQNGKAVGEVTVYADDPVYKNLRALSSAPNAFAGDYAAVNNLVLTKDKAIFTLQNGEFYFLKSSEGKTTGAVFLGKGEFYLMPPVEIEKKSLAIFTDKPDIKESFSKLTMFFTDDTFDQIKNSPNAKMAQNGTQSAAAREAYRDKENLLKKTFHYNIASRTLADIYAPQRKGFFTAFIDGEKFGKLLFQLDPIGLPEVYPEQVELSSYGETDGGIWTAFHLADEYKKGTAKSSTDRRVYDIRRHALDTTVNGTRLIVKDEITLQMLKSNVRFLPFDLYGGLRVSAVKDENGGAVTFIQEKKEEDADFGVILPKPLEVGKTIKLTVEYDGNGALEDAGNGNFILLPRSTWYPNNPSANFGDRAAFDLTFRYPKKYVMVGIGSRVGMPTTEGDTNISKWSSEGIEMAVAGFNYGNFKETQIKDSATDLGLEVFANKTLPGGMNSAIQARKLASIEEKVDLREDTLDSATTTNGSDKVLNQAQDATRIFTAFFGKLPYKRIAMTQQPAGNFGQAWGTLVFMPYTAYFDQTQIVEMYGARGGTDNFWKEVAAHEVAHQWFGHTVGWTSYHDQWMSEGFAEFSASLYIQYVRKDINKFIKFWEGQRDLITKATPSSKDRKPFTVGPVTQGYRLNTAKTGSIAQVMIYPKGAFILHMIRMMMYDKKTGDERFQTMMKDFLASHYNEDISTEDFKRAVEKYMTAAIDVDKNAKMDWFFNEYVYGMEMPSYKFTYLVIENGGKPSLTGKITQSGVSDSFVMRVPVYADFGKGWVNLGAATVIGNSSVDLSNIPLAAAPKKVAIAALQDVLAEKIENVKQ